MTLKMKPDGSARSVATLPPAWSRLKGTVKGRFPRLWRKLKYLKRKAVGFPIRFLQKRLIRKRETIYLGANDEDKWVIEDVYNRKRNGFFLELGAYDGFGISNTYILEKQYGWNGICIEPDPVNFAKLVRERTCICVQACVDGARREVGYLYDGAVGGIIDADTDIKPEDAKPLIEAARKDGRLATVQTKTLRQILKDSRAPRVIDFFSFDVEGAETRILRDFDFDEYVFRALVIERASEELNEVLYRNGYKFVELRVGDSFYIHESIPNFDAIPKKPFRQVPPKPAPLVINFTKKQMTLRLAFSALF
jgi:FkbM family methyltransferase